MNNNLENLLEVIKNIKIFFPKTFDEIIKICECEKKSFSHKNISISTGRNAPSVINPEPGPLTVYFLYEKDGRQICADYLPDYNYFSKIGGWEYTDEDIIYMEKLLYGICMDYYLTPFKNRYQKQLEKELDFLDIENEYQKEIEIDFDFSSIKNAI
jgi:hypothetical protein